MIDLIQNNPFRYLGVYANSPKKDIVANQGKMNAFLKVGRHVSFPIDLEKILSPLERTAENIANANSSLTLPNDKLKAAQFWFINQTHIDQVAFNNLIDGDIEKAMDIWGKQGNGVSAFQKILVCYLIKEDYQNALAAASILYKEHQNDFIEVILGDQSIALENSIVYPFLDTIANEIGVQRLLSLIVNEDWKKYIAKKAITPLISSIQEAISKANENKGQKNPQQRLAAGTALMNGTKISLAELRKLLSATDSSYQMVADKLANTILQCSIDYCNDSEEPDAPRKAFPLAEYANSIACGLTAKERCSDSLKTLKEIISQLPPAQVMAEDRAIKEELRKFCKLPDKISHSITLLNNTKPHLKSMMAKLGATNAYYLKLSTQVVGNALHNVIEEVNAAQTVKKEPWETPLSSSRLSSSYRSIYETDYDRYLNALTIKTQMTSVMPLAWKAITIMDTFDMENDFKVNRYNPNRKTLRSLYDQINALNNPTPTRTSQSSGGCYIATMAYGDYDHPQVMVLRNFRDQYLSKRIWGRWFINTYYKYSPLLVEKLKNKKTINGIIRNILDKIVIRLRKHNY